MTLNKEAKNMQSTERLLSSEDYTDNIVYHAIKKLAALGMNTDGITKIMQCCLDPSEQLMVLETLLRELCEARPVTEDMLSRFSNASDAHPEFEYAIAEECANLLGDLEPILHDCEPTEQR
jgi:hypothetical protein